MSYASQSGRARTSSRNPRAFAVCQRCGIWYNRDSLNFQTDWRGTALQNLYILVCQKCLDVPQEQLRAIAIPADPVPIFYPSVEDFSNAEEDFRATWPPQFDPITALQLPNSQALRTTEDCQNRVTQPFGTHNGHGEYSGEVQNAVMPLKGTIKFGVPLPILSVTSNGSPTVTVTCSGVHNLQLNVNATGVPAQISVEGLSIKAATGFYSANIVTATQFTYQTYGPIAEGSLLTSASRIVTVSIGLPLGFTGIPKIYGPGTLNPAPNNFNILLENGTYFLLLENGDFFELEDGP
jgi:hypothetical protein